MPPTSKVTAGTLYLVATPIGNLGDITTRALETLRASTCVVAEDTRRSRILLDHFGIARPLVSMPAFREGEQAASLVARLLAGDDLALVTDAGSPGISDPGSRLVREALDAGVTVVPVPGPAAVVAALSASGLSTDRFFFVGFLPRKGSGREKLLSSLRNLPATLVIYESPERLAETLSELHELLGSREAVVARELTKLHEEFVRGTLETLAARFEAGARGEITLLVAGVDLDTSEAASDDALLSEIAKRLEGGDRLKEIARELADATGRPKSEVYALGLRLKG